jgi:beta-glucosidase
VPHKKDYQEENMEVKVYDVDESAIDRILARLTLKQKIGFLSGRDFWSTQAIPALGIRGLTLTDGPHGVRIGNETRGGKTPGTATAFPTGTALAATWDTGLIRRVGVALAEETRAAGCDVLLGPCVNIIRVPVAGRNFESFAEDPFLAGKIGVAYVQGLQSRGVGASVKHFACNNQEFERTRGDSRVGERALREIYLTQFEMIVKEARPWTVMCSYNRLNGEHASQNRRLLTSILKEEWGYDGVVVSDWNANHEIYQSVAAGLDLEMPGPAVYYGKFLEAAVKSWQLDEAAVDGAVRRILRLQGRSDAYNQCHPDDSGAFSNPEHTTLAHDAAAASMVLLKNEDGVLPIPAGSPRRIAVIGPTAATASYGGGGSSIVPCAYTVSPLEGIRARYGDAEVQHAPGCRDRVKADRFDRVGLRVTHDGEPGFREEIFGNRELAGAPLIDQAIPDIDFWQIFIHDDRIDPNHFSIRWSGELNPEKTGEYRFKLSYQGLYRLFLDDAPIAADQDWHDREPYPFYTIHKTPAIRLEGGRSYRFRLELVNTLESERNALILRAQRLADDAEIQAEIDEALALVRSADRTIIVAGHAAGYEQEGIDRDDLRLPGAQDRLIAAVLEADPRAVVVLNTGAPVEMPWASRAKAILQAHFFGQEGGRALASVISGAVNPSGRLTTSYPLRWTDSPAYIHYPGNRQAEYGEGIFVGYRYFDFREMDVLFPFGHGLSYTSFEYGALRVEGSLAAGTLQASVTVRNIGGRAGTEIVQLYVGRHDCRELRPPRELKGFTALRLAPGESGEAVFPLDRRAFQYYREHPAGWQLDAGRYSLWAGASSRDLRTRLALEIGTADEILASDVLPLESP